MSRSRRGVSENGSAREHAIPPALAFRRTRAPQRRIQIEIFDRNESRAGPITVAELLHDWPRALEARRQFRQGHSRGI